MKSIVAAAVLVAPAAAGKGHGKAHVKAHGKAHGKAAAPEKVKVVSWNAAAGDKWGYKGNYEDFFANSAVNSANIVLFQEGKRETGWGSTTPHLGVVTMWDESMFEKVGKTECGNVPGSGTNSKGKPNRSGTACTIALKSKNGIVFGFGDEIVLVTNVHAGHNYNGKPSNFDEPGAEAARKEVEKHQRDFVTKYLKGKTIGLVIVGGDHNELGLYLSSTKHAKTTIMSQPDIKFYGHFGDTHGIGAIDKIFASRSGDKHVLKEFGSDHTAIMATIN
jgi:hypothetical protein